MFRVIVPKTFWYVDKNVKLKRERVFYLWARKKAQGNQNPERKKTLSTRWRRSMNAPWYMNIQNNLIPWQRNPLKTRYL